MAVLRVRPDVRELLSSQESANLEARSGALLLSSCDGGCGGSMALFCRAEHQSLVHAVRNPLVSAMVSGMK